MKAAVLTAFDSCLVLTEVPAPQIARPHDVVVRVTGAGVCGSDLHLVEGAFREVLGVPLFPYILGHENAGYVAAIGQAVTTVRVGDPVLIHPHITCGICRACRRGHEAFCETLLFPGIDGHSPGGFAEFMCTSERAILKLPAGVDPASMASLTDAGLTAYHAVRRACSDLAPDGTAMIMGVGGVGNFALQLLRIFSPARIIAVDLSRERLRGSEHLGADLCWVADEDLVARVLEETGGLGVDLVMDCVGAAPVPNQSMAMLRRGGVYSVLGADKGEACCGTVGLTGRELTIKGNLVGTLGELTELTQLALRGRLRLGQRFYRLEDAARAFSDVRAGRVSGRAVLVPSEFGPGFLSSRENTHVES